MDSQPLKAFGRSLTDFGQLSLAEQKLLDACRIGTMAFISENRPMQADGNNTVRASFLRFLALGGDEYAPVHEMGVPLLGAWVEGELDLEGAILPHNLALGKCHLSTIILRNSNVHGFVSFHGCHVDGLVADRMVCSNSVFLKDGFIATGTVRLEGVQIGCDLICDKGEFHGKDANGLALLCDSAVIKGNVLLSSGFSATGIVRLVETKIGGSLQCIDAVFNNTQSDHALECDRAVIKGGVFLNGSFTATGTVSLSGAQIGGGLECGNGKFDGKGGDALSCAGAVINGDVFLRAGFTAIGTVSLRGAQIGGVLECGNGKFDGKGGNALMCENTIVKGTVSLTKGFSAIGTVHLRSVRIGCNLMCKGKFDGNGGNALLCDGAVINGAVFLNGGFTAIGEVRLLEAQIGGSLECRDASFSKAISVVNSQNTFAVVNDKRLGEQHDGALVCDRAVIKGSVFLMGGFVATGTVRLLGAQISGDMECSTGATLIGVNGIALKADGMTVAGAFIFRNLKSVKGIVSLLGVKVGGLIDGDHSWLEGELNLDGFVYDRLAGNAPTDAKSRLAWLDKQSALNAGLAGGGNEFKPQPWRQLQKVLHDMGHVEDARQVAIAFEDRLRDANLIGQTPKSWNKQIAWMYRKISRVFHWFFGWLIGYGYRPIRLFLIMLAVWLACGMFYWCAALNGVFAPSNPLVFQNLNYAVCVPDSKAANAEKAKAELAKSACVEPPPIQGAGNWYLCENLREEYTSFSPLAYSLDLILPLVDLQQERDWAPMIPTPNNTWTDELSEFSLKHVTRFMLWFEILFGWMSSLLLVAVVSGLTKRREE